MTDRNIVTVPFSASSAIPLKADNGLDSGVIVGTDKEYLQFFWVHTAGDGPDLNTVSVSVTAPGFPGGRASARFEVYEPTSTFGITLETPTALDPLDNPQFASKQIHVTGTVKMPAATGLDTVHNVGMWKAVQLINVDDTRTIVGNGYVIYQDASLDGIHSINGNTFLDGWDPYNFWDDFLFPPFPANGISETMVDAPDEAVSPGKFYMNMDDKFTDYLMFKPPGGTGSRWVPLMIQGWDWNVVFGRQNKGANVNAVDFSLPEPPESTDVEPEWAGVIPFRGLTYTNEIVDVP